MFTIHTIAMPDGAGPQAFFDRVLLGMQLGLANAAGGGAGAAVTVAVTVNESLPPNYGVLVQPGQDATWYISGKTSSGFTINLLPRLAANTLAAGAIDVFIFAC